MLGCRESVGEFWLGKACDADVLSVDIENDLALVKLSKDVIRTSNILCVFVKDPPDFGDLVFMVGHPNITSFPVKKT